MFKHGINENGKLVFRSSRNGRYGEVHIKNGYIEKAYTGGSYEKRWDCTHKKHEAIAAISESPVCLAEILEVLDKEDREYGFATKLLKDKKNQMQQTLDIITETLTKLGMQED